MSKIFEAYEQLLSQGIGDDKRFSDEQVVEGTGERRVLNREQTPIQPLQPTIETITPPPPVIQSREPKPEYEYDPEVKTMSDLTGVELEAEPYYNQDREKKIRAKQKAMLIADTLRLIGQGVAGSNGMLINKDPENKGMQRTQAELERMRELYDADVRRVRDINLNKAIRETDLKNQREWSANQNKEEKKFRAQELSEQRAYNEKRDSQKNVDEMEMMEAKNALALDLEKVRYDNNYKTMNAELKERERIAKEAEAAKTAKTELEKEVYATVNGFIDEIDNEPDYKKRAEMMDILDPRLQRALEGRPSKEEMIEIYEKVKGYQSNKQGTGLPLGDMPDSLKKLYPTGTQWTNTQSPMYSLPYIFILNGERVQVPENEVPEFNKKYPNAKRDYATEEKLTKDYESKYKK